MLVSDSATLKIFTPFSYETKDLSANGRVDIWAYDACVPLCGKDANLKWQATQEVTRKGKRGKEAIFEDSPRFVCEYVDVLQTPIENPVNNNTAGNSPPVWVVPSNE